MSRRVDDELADELRCVANGCRGSDGRARARQLEHWLCASCAARGRRTLDELWQLYRALSCALVPGRRGSDERIAAAKPGSRAPINDPALYTRDEIAALLLAQAELACDELRLAPMPLARYTRELARVQRAHDVLTRQWERLQPYALSAHVLDKGSRLRQRAERVLGYDRLVHRLPAPCPSCDTLALVRRDGDDAVRCTRCRAQWSEAEYRRLVLVLADEYRRTGSA